MRTLIYLVILVAGTAAYDVWLIQTYGKAESISATVIRWSYEYPSLPFLGGFGIGFVMGHLFWRMKEKDIGFKK